MWYQVYTQSIPFQYEIIVYHFLCFAPSFLKRESIQEIFFSNTDLQENEVNASLTILVLAFKQT